MVHRGKAALAILEVNEVREVIHHRGQKILFRNRCRLAGTLFRYLPAETRDDVGFALCRLELDSEIHLDKTPYPGRRADHSQFQGEFGLLAQGSGHLLDHSRAIFEMEERQEIVVLPGETTRLNAEDLVHPGIPAHRSVGEIAFERTHLSRSESEVQPFKQFICRKTLIFRIIYILQDLL